MDYHSMKRKELQALCKKHNIPANSANSVLADKLSQLLIEKKKPIAQQRTCIKSSVEDADDGEPAVAKKQAKKVRFSPNNDLVEYEPGKKQMAMVTETKVQRKSAAKKVDKSVINSNNTVDLIEDGAQVPVKLTRSRVQGEQAVNNVEKGTNVVKETEGNHGRATRSKAHTLGNSDAVQLDETKPRKREVKDVKKVGKSVTETVVEHARVTRSKGQSVQNDELSKEMIDIPARVTRSKGQTSKEDIGNTVNNPRDGKKRTRREMKLTDMSKNSSNVAPEDDQKLPKRKSLRTKGGENVNEGKGDKVEVVSEIRVTISKDPLAKKSPAKNNKSETENKIEVQQPEEPLKQASKRNVNRRKSVVSPEKNEAVLHLEEPVKRRTRQHVAKKHSKVQSGRVSMIDECLEVKENVTRRSRRGASENETKTVSSATGSPKSRKRRGNVEVEYVSPVDESSKCSTRSERKLVAENQLESSTKTPVSMKNESAVKNSRIRGNSSIKRAKLSGKKLGDSENHDVKSNKDGTPISKIGSFELGKKVMKAEITPVIDESHKRFTRSSIKDPSQSAIEDQPTGNVRFSSRKVAKFKPDTVFSTAPGRITRTGIKHGRNSASNFDIKKQQSRSTRTKNRFGDDTEMFSPEVAEDRPNPDAPIEIQPEISPNPEVSLEAPSETRPNPDAPIEIQPEIRPYLEVTETRPNLEMKLDFSSEILPNPDMALEVQSETRPNPDVPIEVPTEIRPNSEVTLEVQSEIGPNLDVTVEVESETRSNPDVPIEVQSESRPNPEVNLQVESEIQPNPDIAAEIESEIRHNPDLPTETRSENFEMGPILKKSGDFLASESLGLPTKVVEEYQDGTGTAIVTESVCPVLGENRDSNEIFNGSYSREKDVDGTPVDANISNLKMTPFSKAEVTETTPYAVPDGSIVQNQSLGVNFSLFGESEGQAAVNAQTSGLSAGNQEVYEKEIELTEPVASIGKTVVIEENADNSVEGADNKHDSISYIGTSAAAFHSSFEQSDVKSKMKEVEVADENDIKDGSVGEHAELSTGLNITYGVAMDDVADDVIDSGKEPVKELEFEVVPSIGNDVQEVPILGKSDCEDEDIDVINVPKDIETCLGPLTADMTLASGDTVDGEHVGDDKNDMQDGDYVHEGLTSNDIPAVDEQYVGGEDSVAAKSISGDDLAADREPEPLLSVSGVDLAGDSTLELGDKADSECALDEKNDMQDGGFVQKGLTDYDNEKNDMQDGEYVRKGSTSDGIPAMDEQYAGGDDSMPTQNDREPELVSSVFGDDFAADNTLGLGDTVEGERVVEKIDMQDGEYVHTGLTSYDIPDEQHIGADDSASAQNDHEREPVLSVLGDDVAATTVDAREESVLDINKDAVSNIFGDIYTSNDSGHEEDVLGTSELDECVNSKESENVSCDTGNEPRQEESETATENDKAPSDREEQKVATVDSDMDTGKFIEDSSNFCVDHESPTREESSSIVYKREEPAVDVIASVEHMGDTGDHGRLIMKEETPVGDEVLNWPKEDDINTQEENQNMNMDIDWGDYSFGMDEYQKPDSANECDEKVDDLEKDSSYVAEEKSNQGDILKEKENEDMTEEIFNWSGSSLKSLFTSASSRISHIKHGQEDAVIFANQDHYSSVKAVYATSSTTQISPVKEVGAEAVAHDYNHEMEIKQSKVFNQVGGSENEMYGAVNFEDYPHRNYFEDEEAGGSSDISGKKKDFEFKQFDLPSEVAGTTHGLKDDTITGGELEKKEETELKGFGLETGDHDLAFDKGVGDM